MTDYDSDFGSFNEFWEAVEAYAEEIGVSTSYLEEEFILEGKLHRVDIPLTTD